MNANEPAPSPRRSRGLVWLGRLVRFTLMAGMLAAAGYVAWYWMNHRPTAERHPRPKIAALVEVEPLASTTHRVIVRGMGPVVPARSIQLAARLSGDVISVAPEFVPGGFFQAGEEVLRLEPKDFELAVKQRESDLAKAEADLKMEMGQQAVSRREYELLGEEVGKEDEALVLRGPQLEIAAAAVAVARAALDKARLDLARTRISAPFNAVVEQRNVDVGSQVSPGSNLATLVGTDQYWIEATIPVDQLKWIDIPSDREEAGSPARIRYEMAWEAGVHRTGVVQRLLTSIEEQGMLARLLVVVEDPLGLAGDDGERPPLLLGSRVRTAIAGREVGPVFEIPRTALHEGDRVWVMLPGETLDIRNVVVVWSNDDFVYVSEGLSDGDLLVTTDLGAPVQGMALRTTDSPEMQPEGHEDEIASQPPAE